MHTGKVTLKGTSKRGKSRIQEHGDTFLVRRFEGTLGNSTKVFVDAMDNSGWFGWFALDSEVEVISIEGIG